MLPRNERYIRSETDTRMVIELDAVDGAGPRSAVEGQITARLTSHTHIALFHDSIETTCRGQPLLGERLCEAAQYGVWLHEIGHALGLVDNGLAMVSPHEDAAHPGHDRDEGCLMYYAYEGSEGLAALTDSLLGGGSVADFDAQCLADLAAVRDR